MDTSDDNSVLSYAMDVVTSDDHLVFPIGNLHLPKSGPLESVPLESGPIDSGDIIPWTVYMSDSDPEDNSDRSGQVVQAPSSMPRLNPSSGCYTAASFADVPDEWLS